MGRRKLVGYGKSFSGIVNAQVKISENLSNNQVIIWINSYQVIKKFILISILLLALYFSL